MFNSKGKLNYEVSDKVLPLIKKYNKRVIVDGVQIMDNTMTEKARSYFKDEPIIVLQTGKKISAKRAMKRDDVDISKLKDEIERRNKMWELKSSLEKELSLSIAEDYVDQLLGKKR